MHAPRWTWPATATLPACQSGRGPLLILLAVLAVLLPGCSIYDYLYGGSKTQSTGRRSDQELLRSAEANIQSRKYDQARKDAQQLLNQYPESDLQAAARLAAGRAFYMEKKYDEAKAEFQRFLELYPQNERVDEAHYYMGMSYFRQTDTPDRDQTFTKKALEEFNIILTQMPDSQFAGDAREKRQICRRKLAEHEMVVGKFYFEREQYNAAAGRFTALLTEYQDTGVDDQALYYLGESLWRLEQRDAARRAFQRLVEEYSQSPLAQTAADRIDIVLVKTGAPPPKGPGFFGRMWQGMKESWDEFLDTVKDYHIFQ
jgi:outer membrane protein assembly factor BamD